MIYFVDERSLCLLHAAFVCFKVLLMQLQQNYEQNREIILFALFSCMSCLSSLQMRQKSKETVAALQYNIKQFLKCLYKDKTVAQCPVLIVAKTFAVHRDFDQYDVSISHVSVVPVNILFLQEMVAMLCDLHYSVYSDFSWWVAEALISDQKQFRAHLPNVALQLVAHTHGSQTQEKKDLLVDVLTLNLIKLCGDSSLEIAESALGNLEMIVGLNDNSVKNAVKVIKLVTSEPVYLLRLDCA